MICDGSESAVRATQPRSEEEIDKIVGKIIQQRVETGELDDSGLTLADLKTIRSTIVGTLKGVYHPRILYPEDKSLEPSKTPKVGSATQPPWEEQSEQ